MVQLNLTSHLSMCQENWQPNPPLGKEYELDLSLAFRGNQSQVCHISNSIISFIMCIKCPSYEDTLEHLQEVKKKNNK